MRWFPRLTVCLALALCAWIALPGGAGAAPRAPVVHSVLEARDANDDPVLVLMGFKVNALKTLTVRSDDKVRPPYAGEAEQIVKSGKLVLWKLPIGIVSDRGPDLYDLVFTYGKKATELTVNVRLNFGAAAPKSVDGTSLDIGAVDTQHLSAGLLADLEDADTLNGFDSDFLRDATNLTGALPNDRFSAWDDLLNEENRVGTGTGQLALGDHTHDIGDGLQRTAGVLSVTFSGTGSTPFASRSDHDHAGTFAPAFATGAGLDLNAGTLSVLFGGTGGLSSAARSDHQHDLVYATAAHTHDTNYFTQQDLSVGGNINDSGNPVDWTKLKNVPLALSDGKDDDTTYAAGTGLVLSSGQFRADFAGDGTANSVARSDHAHGNAFATLTHTHDQRYYTQTQLSSGAGLINAAGNPLSWTQLKDVPAGFVDGVDDNTTYTAGTGLSLLSGEFALAFAGTGTANAVARSDHDHTGVYEPAGHNHDLSYPTRTDLATVGTINGVSNPVDWTQLKGVPAGFVDGVDDGSNLSAGPGLNLVSGEYSVIFGGSGASSSSARSDHDHTGVYADSFATGSGLVLNSGTLSVGFGGDGVANTASRSDHDHDLVYYLKTELNDTGGTINTSTNPVDWSKLKNVPAGFIDGVDDSAIYTAGDGLTLTGTQFDVDFAGDGTALTVSHSDHDHDMDYLRPDGQQTTGSISLTQSSGTTVIADNTGSGYAVRGTSSGGGIGVRGLATHSTGTGVRGENSTTTGTNYGMLGRASSPQGTAVLGDNISSGTGVHGDSSGGNGVYGTSTTGTGVRGESTSTTFGTGHGVHGVARAVGAAALFGDHLGTFTRSGNAVYGRAAGTVAAMFGDNTGGGRGVRGRSNAGEGVFGEATSTLGTNYGVYGIARGSDGRGVYGSGNTYGVQGQTFTGGTAGVSGSGSGSAMGVVGTGATGVKGDGGTYGVHGVSSAGRGVFGEATHAGLTNYGVYGTSASSLGIGVYAENTNTAGTGAYAVYGVAASTSAAAIYGLGSSSDAKTGTGVVGEGRIGVLGKTASTTGSALRAENEAGSGATAYGVYGYTRSTAAAGVHGRGHPNTDGSGLGVYGLGDTGVRGSGDNIGVHGHATSTTVSNTGVHGQTDSTAGRGVFAEATRGGASSVALLVDHSDTVTTTGNLAIFQDQGANVARIDRTGQGIFNGGTATSGADFAESVAVNAPKSTFEPGDVMIIDRKGTRRFALSKTADSPRVAGIYSTRPGVLARPGDVANSHAWKDTEVPLAITGIVPCKVSGEGGAIEAGDLLVSAAVAGHAKKAPANAKQGTIVAKALGSFDGKTGKIEVLITMR